jgi:starch phosphorylase
MERPEAWAPLAEVDPGQLWATHQILKSRLLSFAKRRIARTVGDEMPAFMPGSGLDQEVLTIGFARRFATYKRANLIMEDIERFQALVSDADRPIQILYAGKAHPADQFGKQLIKNIVDKTTDPAFKGRIVFLENYDINTARYLIRGVDLWLNNPRRPQEACGTSGQKTVLNGVLNCSVLDGWWAEAYDGRNGFAIGRGREFTDPRDQDANDLEALYRVLEEEVIPLYYDRNAEGLPLAWIQRMKWAILSLGWRFNANRMLLDYLRSCYLPAAGATTCGF